MADLPQAEARPSFSQVVIQHIEPLSQLPGVQVDYARIVDLTAKQQYEDLRQLYHRLKLGGKGVAVEDRARHVIQYAIEARTALIKLLALLKWKNQADVEQVLPNGEKQGRVSLAFGLDQWQDQQNVHNREVRNQLEVWAEDLKRFQLQIPDIATAVDLLIEGKFKRGPQYLDEAYIPPRPLTTEGRTQTLRSMNDLLTYRLRVEEELPETLEVVDIRDGKLYLRADRLFECALTLGTIDPRRQWLLADFRFLYIAKQNIKGKNSHPAHIPDEVKTMLCQTVDNVLGGIYEARMQTEQRLAPTELLPRQNTFCKLYDLLQFLSLSHQLETLHRQAKQLEASEWAGNLRVRMSGDRRSFVMTYWSKPGSTANVPPGRQSLNSLSTHGGEIVVRIAPIASQGQNSLYGPVLHEESASHTLEVNWHPEASWLGIAPGTRPVINNEIFSVDADDLDIEPILLDIVTYHAEQLTESLKIFIDERLGSAGIFHKDDIAVATTELGSNVVLRVYDDRWLKLQINTVTGKLHIGEADATIASGVEARLATSSRLANIHTDKLLDVLINTRTMLARDALEEKLRCLEVQPLRDLGVSIQELDTHNLASTGPGQPMKPILHAALPADPDKSVLLAMHASSLTVAIVHFGYRTNAPSTTGGMIAGEKRSILDMEWLNVTDLPVGQVVNGTAKPKTIMMYDRIARTQIQALTFELSLDDLQKIFAFCNAVVTTRSIHTQLMAAGISPIAETEAVPLKLLATGLAPERTTKRKLAIPSKALFSDPQVYGMISSTVNISVERGLGNTIGVGKIIARLALKPKSLSIAAFAGQAKQDQMFQENLSGWTIRLDTRANSASFAAETTRCQDYVQGLIEQLSRISMLLRLLAETEQVAGSEDGVEFKIERYDLTGVSVGYWPSQAISLSTPVDKSTSYQIREIDLELADRTKSSVTSLLQTILSAEIGYGLGLLGFFQYARLVAPILEAVVGLNHSSTTTDGRAEFAVCTKRHWMILWDKGTEQRYGLSINFMFSGECQDWSGGYLISDASASVARDGSNLVDIVPTPKWKTLVKRCNGEEKVGIELEKNGDLVVRAGRGEVKMFKRLLGELDALSR